MSGFTTIAGLDEAGRGPLAGPVVAAAVVLPKGLLIAGVNDSKQVSEKERERLYDVIVHEAACYGIGIAAASEIDQINILQATIVAMERALDQLSPRPDYLLLDAVALPRVALPQRSLVKGDCLSHTIAAASILAKVARDRIMLQLHERYPQYNFGKHKGYGTVEHRRQLREHGPCPEHRRSFAPVAKVIEGSSR